MKILIKNGHIVDPDSGKNGNFDLLIKDGIIDKVEKKIEESDSVLIDASGKYVFPGLIDLHVHFREPGLEYKETIETGLKAAVKGGFTTVCPMPNTKPVIDCAEQVKFELERAGQVNLAHMMPVGAVTKGQMGQELADIEGMVAAGAAAISEDGKSVMNAALYQKGMEMAKVQGIPVFAHCEDKELVGRGVMNAGKKAKELGMEGISNAVEDVIIARDILLAKETKVHLHLCHCSTKDSVEMVRIAKEKGISVTAEVCPHHFTLTEEDIKRDDANYKMNPPLRTREDVQALRKGLKENIIEVIATDHAPHSKEEKARSIAEAPFGITGLETAFPLSYTVLVQGGYLTIMQLIEKMSWNPAKILGIEKGSLKPGKAADITIAELEEEYTIRAEEFVSKGKNTPFEGKKVKGRIVITIVDGKVVYQ